MRGVLTCSIGKSVSGHISFFYEFGSLPVDSQLVGTLKTKNKHSNYFHNFSEHTNSGEAEKVK